jgi:hypothetical protein
MENKNYSPIRNKMSLIETIKQSLDEDLIASAAREGKLVASELEAYLKIMIKDQKIAAELTKNGIRTAEELLAALKGNRLSKTLKGSLELSVLKSNTKNAKLIDLASENLVRNKVFDQKYAAEFAKGQPAYEKALKQAGYSEDAITKIVQKKFNQIDPKTGKPYARPETIAKKDIGATSGKPNPKPNVPPAPSNIKTLWEKWKTKIQEQLKKKRSWKEMVAWGAGLGIGAAALWYMLDGFVADGEKPAETPPTPPADDTQWAPCIKELLDSKEGTIMQVGASKLTVVHLVTAEYPEGLNFVSNGRVADVKTGKMGTWKCKDGQVKIAESKIMSLTRLVLNEQANEISDETMDTYVDDAVDDLDGYVAEYNLQSLFDILTALKGKTNNGEDAIKKFLEYYKEDEDADFVSDVQGVGVRNLSVKAKNMKTQIIALANNTSTQPVTPGVTPPVAGKIGLSKIDISWDGEKKDETPVGGGSVGGGSKSGVNYHDCSSKDFPFEFGCISPKIAEIQGCLGITPQKGYFGPKTKRTMEPTYDLSGGITKEIYDAVKAKCGGAETAEPERKKYSDAELAPISRPKISDIKPIDTGKLGDLSGKITPINTGNQGESIYKMLQSNYGDGSNPEFPYIFSELGRLKYKGESMGEDAKDQLSQYVATLGYREESIKDKDKGYGVKYVWVKQ